MGAQISERDDVVRIGAWKDCTALRTASCPTALKRHYLCAAAATGGEIRLMAHLRLSGRGGDKLMDAGCDISSEKRQNTSP